MEIKQIVINKVISVTVDKPILWSTKNKYHQRIVVTVEGEEDAFIDLFSELESNLINLK